MKFHTLLLLLVLVVVAAFAVLNWDVFVAPAALSLGFTIVQMPLGVVMLGLLAVVIVLFLAYVVYLQTTVLLDTRRHARELHANRELADKAEASRFTELRIFIEAEFTRQRGANAEVASLARLDSLERSLTASIEQSANALSAHLGEIEDRLEHTNPMLPERRP